MRRIVATLALAGAVIAPAAAGARADTIVVRPSARPDVARVSRPLIAAVLDAARHTTPDAPCAGRMRIVFNASSNDIANETGYTGPAAGVAPADGSCRAYVAPQLDRWYLCRVTAHEYRHAAGYGHTNDPRDLMYSGTLYLARVPACDRALRAYHRQEATR